MAEPSEIFDEKYLQLLDKYYPKLTELFAGEQFDLYAIYKDAFEFEGKLSFDKIVKLGSILSDFQEELKWLEFEILPQHY